MEVMEEKMSWREEEDGARFRKKWVEMMRMVCTGGKSR